MAYTIVPFSCAVRRRFDSVFLFTTKIKAALPRPRLRVLLSESSTRFVFWGAFCVFLSMDPHTWSSARAQRFLIFTHRSEERETSTPTWYRVWYLCGPARTHTNTHSMLSLNSQTTHIFSYTGLWSSKYRFKEINMIKGTSIGAFSTTKASYGCWE